MLQGCLGIILLVVLILAARPVVPAYITSQRENIERSAHRHGIAPEVVAAVLYNEMIGQEHRFLMTVLPGHNPVVQALRDGILGWHFLTLKQAQWITKGLAALVGLNTTVGPTGIRVSVGREIRQEVVVMGGLYQPHGLAERPTLILDLMRTPTAIEYLAANLERGQRRSLPRDAGDWTPLARWHNTGLTFDRADVPRPIWDKGTRYVARVETFLPHVTAMLNQPPPAPVVQFWAQLLQHATEEQFLLGLSPRHIQPATIMIGYQ